MEKKSPNPVYVIGHLNPDADSVCSAIGYAFFKNVTDERFSFIPVRAGKLNRETGFILDKFRIPAPAEMESLSATVGDLNLKRPITVGERDSIRKLALLMRSENVRTVPVVSDSGRLAGIAGLKDIAGHYIDSVGFSDPGGISIELDTLLETLEAKVAGNTGGKQFLEGRIFVATGSSETVMNGISRGDIALVGDRHDLQLDLIRSGCSALLLVEDAPAWPDVIDAASDRQVILISSPHNSFAAAQLLTMSGPVSAIMSSSYASVGLYSPISEVRSKVLESEYRSVAVTDSENRPIGLITRTDLLEPVRKTVVVVDHNEITQAIDGIEEAEILEIIDHHRVGDMSTTAPIYVQIDPVGSTCTIVADSIFLHRVGIPAEIAGVLLSGVLSDTIMLTLSTTTKRDMDAAQRLAEIAGIDIGSYSRELLQAGIDIEGRNASELISADFKEYAISGRRLGVSQLMALDFREIDRREDELLEELERIRAVQGYDLTVLLITNPLDHGKERILLKGEKWIVENAFNVKLENDSFSVDRMLSRKKDFIPAVGRALSLAGTERHISF